MEPSYMQSVIEQNIDMWRMTVMGNRKVYLMIS